MDILLTSEEVKTNNFYQIIANESAERRREADEGAVLRTVPTIIAHTFWASPDIGFPIGSAY